MKCGVLADGESFPLIAGVGARRRSCHLCVNRQKKQDREERGIGLPAPRPPEAMQTSKWKHWSEFDDRLLRDALEAGLGYEEIAVALGRSLRAVYKRRSVLGITAVRTKHRVEQPWKVEVES